MFRSIKEALTEILSDEKLKPALEKGNLSTCWKESVGALINENTQIKSFKNLVKDYKPSITSELFPPRRI